MFKAAFRKGYESRTGLREDVGSRCRIKQEKGQRVERTEMVRVPSVDAAMRGSQASFLAKAHTRRALHGSKLASCRY